MLKNVITDYFIMLPQLIKGKGILFPNEIPLIIQMSPLDEDEKRRYLKSCFFIKYLIKGIVFLGVLIFVYVLWFGR